MLCYYRSQMMFIRRLIGNHPSLRGNRSIHVCTVDSSESISSDIVLILISNDSCSKNEYVHDPRRFVFTLSRAAKAIYVFGHMSELYFAFVILFNIALRICVSSMCLQSNFLQIYSTASRFNELASWSILLCSSVFFLFFFISYLHSVSTHSW